MGVEPMDATAAVLIVTTPGTAGAGVITSAGVVIVTIIHAIDCRRIFGFRWPA
jgi:hypothetical protein